MKGDRFPENKQAREILCRYGIDPYLGCENLTISQNHCHSKWYAEQVLNALKRADATGDVEAVKRALRQLASLHNSCSDNGNSVNPEIDE